MMLACQSASQGFVIYSFAWHLHVMAWKYIRVCRLARCFSKQNVSDNQDVTPKLSDNFIVSHKALEALHVAAPAMLELETKLCNLIC